MEILKSVFEKLHFVFAFSCRIIVDGWPNHGNKAGFLNSSGVARTGTQVKVIPEFCIAHSYCARILRHQRARVQNIRDFLQTKLDSEIKANFL